MVSSRVEDFSPEEISVLRDRTGISIMGKSLDTLIHCLGEFVKKCEKEPERNPRCQTVSWSSNQAEVRENSVVVFLTVHFKWRCRCSSLF